MTVDLDKFQSYSNYLDSYKKSIRHLYDGLTEKKITALDAAFPMLFLMRHFLEIGYKGNIYHLAKTSDVTDGLNDATHDLPTLHTAFKIQFTAAAAVANISKPKTKEFNKYHRKLGGLVKLFDRIDRKGIAFRYPSKKGSTKSPQGTIDLEKTYQDFDEAKEALIYLEDFMVGNLAKFDQKKDWILAGGIWNDSGTWQDDKKLIGGI